MLYFLQLVGMSVYFDQDLNLFMLMRRIFFIWSIIFCVYCISDHSVYGQIFKGPLGHLTEVKPASKSRRVSSANPNRSSNADQRHIPAGQTLVIADLKGEGFINHIWITCPPPGPSWLGDNPDHSEIVIRMYWDGAEKPAVEAPLGDFFAAGFGKRNPINSVPVFVEEGDSYNCFWIMPFYKSARIELVNQSDKNLGSTYFQVDYSLEKLPANTPYFCAQYNQQFPVPNDTDYLILDAEGMGHYVGTVMSGRSRSPEWFGEGDEKFYIDGDMTPTIQGTGTEDYALHAWGMNRTTTYPYCGIARLEGEWGMVGWWITYYRWHIVDPIRFNKSLKVTIEDVGWMSEDEVAEGEYRGHVDRNDDFASVAFWYQIGQPKHFTTLPSAAERRLPNLDIVTEGKELMRTAKHSPGNITLQKGYEWTGDGQLLFFPEKGLEKDAYLECQFVVNKKELVQPTLRVTQSYDFGAYRILLDGKEIRPLFNFYSPETTINEISLGQMTLETGVHTLRFEYVGKAELALDAGLGIDSFRLRKRWGVKRHEPKNFNDCKSYN